MSKDYEFEITLKFTQIMSAENQKQALKIVKETFFEDYGITLKNNEIELIK